MCAKCKTPFLCGQGNFANFLFLACPMSISGSNRFVDQRRVKIHILAEAENQTQTPPVGYYVILPFSVCLSKVSYMPELHSLSVSSSQFTKRVVLHRNRNFEAKNSLQIIRPFVFSIRNFASASFHCSHCTVLYKIIAEL